MFDKAVFVILYGAIKVAHPPQERHLPSMSYCYG